MSVKKCCIGFLRDQDLLGSSVSLHYKGSEGYGTCLGGFFSLLGTIFFTLFTFMQLYAWIFVPSYN